MLAVAPTCKQSQRQGGKQGLLSHNRVDTPDVDRAVSRLHDACIGQLLLLYRGLNDSNRVLVKHQMSVRKMLVDPTALFIFLLRTRSSWMRDGLNPKP